MGGVKLSTLIFRMLSPLSASRVSVVDDAVEDGIRNGWIGDNLVPVVDRH